MGNCGDLKVGKKFPNQFRGAISSDGPFLHAAATVKGVWQGAGAF